jgi:acyl-CoA synthetase (AMP-forming)/AMP-acid ligase II
MSTKGHPRESQLNDFAVGAKTIVDVLRRRAELTPTRRAFQFLESGEREGAAYTFAELDRKAKAIGYRLASIGAKGKRVLLPHPPGLDFVAGFFGCLYAGAVAVPGCSSLLSTRQRARLKFLLEDGEAEIMLVASTTALAAFRSSLVDEDGVSRLTLLAVDEVSDDEGANWSPVDCKPDDVAYIQYTSGSTSDPRGVMISHSNIMTNQQMIQSAFGNKEDRVVVSWLPQFHDMGLVGVLQQGIYAGMGIVLLAPLDFIRRPARWLRAISKYHASASGAPNFAYDLCVERVKDEELAEVDLSCWKLAFNGSEPVRAETMESFAEKFGKAGFRSESFYPCYGLAEATLFVSCRVAGEPLLVRQVDAMNGRRDKLGKDLVSVPHSGRQVVGCGKLWGAERVAIVDPKTFRRCPTGSEGEIWVAGPHVAKGYWKRRAETREIFGARLSDTGEGPFLRTGDFGYLVDGELYITGRLKELIILNGKNHYPQDIEATVAKSHPLLRRNCGAAFSVDVTGREELVIFQEVQSRTPLESVGEIQGAIRQALAEDRAIRPYSVVLFKPNSIPKTSSGKIKRSACRTEFIEQSFTAKALS